MNNRKIIKGYKTLISSRFNVDTSVDKSKNGIIYTLYSDAFTSLKFGFAENDKVLEKKLSNDNCIGIFIDGTRQKNGRVNKPKQGAALLAFKNQKLLLPVAIINSNRLIRFRCFIPLFSKIVIKVGNPVQPPQSSSRHDLNSVTMHLEFYRPYTCLVSQQ